MKFQILITCLAAILMTSCQKKDDEIADPSKVNIQISSPANGQTFHVNDSVYIKATIDYPGELHGYEVKIVDTVTGTVIYDKANHVHTDKFVIDESWPASATQPTELKMTVITYIDHDNHSAQKDLKIKIVP